MVLDVLCLIHRKRNNVSDRTNCSRYI
uniref:Uncharacterized protein n=1 Tax=Anguilla anguilla TaxID=7936 RepID=A0A0E9Q880_ANGAN